MPSARTIDGQRGGDRNQNSGVPAQIVAPNRDFSFAAKGHVNAKAGNHEKDDDRWHAVDYRAPSALKKVPQT